MPCAGKGSTNRAPAAKSRRSASDWSAGARSAKSCARRKKRKKRRSPPPRALSTSSDLGGRPERTSYDVRRGSFRGKRAAHRRPVGWIDPVPGRHRAVGAARTGGPADHRRPGLARHAVHLGAAGFGLGAGALQRGDRGPEAWGPAEPLTRCSFERKGQSGPRQRERTDHARFRRKIKTGSGERSAVATPPSMALDLSLLNPQQRQAVVRTEGPVLVLAGAGSGKTRVIAHRVVHLLERGVPARAILAVTFTNKAAAEMKDRIALLAGDRQRCRGLTVSTFHAFGVRVLREHGARLGLPERFAIFDAGDQGALVKRLLREVKVDDRRFDPGKVVAILSRLRTSGEPGHPDDEYELIDAELKPRYELGLRTMGAVDFDDLLLLPLRLLEDRELLEQYQRRYRYLLVDEYQDTNEAQFRLLERLAGVRRNLCAVGDDDQSIYSWRGAQVRNLLGCDATFPGGHEVFLEQNYRSTGAILEAANAVIGKNPGRKPKHLWTDRGRGANVRVVSASDDDAEARYVADEVLRVAYEDKLPLGEIAVLYRTNAQARPLDGALRLSGVRYRAVGGTSLFDRKEVRDLIAYLRAALNPRDEVALLRIVNVPAR